MIATYFFSFRSPYSWLASLGMKNRISDHTKFELVPFFEPDEKSRVLLENRGGEFPYRDMSSAKHRYILNDVSRLTKKFGLSNKWPVDPNPWWEPSHNGYLMARKLGYGMSFFWQVYHARWQEAIDISMPENIEKICLAAGIPAKESLIISTAMENEEIREEGVDALYRVYKEDIFGVPMFTLKRKQYWGIDRLNDFLAEIDEPLLSNDEYPVCSGYPLDFDHAGACG